jgi:hypothetical protein
MSYDELIARISKIHFGEVFLYSHVIPAVRSTSKAAIVPDKPRNRNRQESISNFSAQTQQGGYVC